ncbi:hypothetical protein GVO57_10480 [Sphingomonas changnyeongensis]|uniref:Uncharacterized protein n=1 Tax=Sphingomonas changnyeongensis TaxID=2698679 RepID=A0A7Z2NXH2_9SPHN|nr:hypothetical protein [Sphingomonas changnyeongensis]QHL91165.1 hypothetical protein GVO57_10480 [Sphingomonas changnyeongensis]
MAGARAMLARARRLAQARSPASPFELAYGSLDAWAADWQAQADAGLLDRRDTPVILAAVRRWHRDGAWAR